MTVEIVNNPDMKYVNLVEIVRNQKNIGFNISLGSYIKLSEKFALNISGSYNALPFAKIGIQEKNLQTINANIGVSYSFK